MQNAGLNESQTGIKIARRNINNLRYADDTTLMAESEEELKSFWWGWKRVKTGLKLNIQKTKITTSSPKLKKKKKRNLNIPLETESIIKSFL